MSVTSKGTSPAHGQRLQVLRILWIAHLASVLVFGVVGVVVSRAGAGSPETAALIRPVLAVVGVAVGALSLWWRTSFAVSPKSPLYLFVEERGEAQGQAPAADSGAGRLLTNCVIVWAMSESIAAFGLVLTLLSRDPAESVAFLGAAAVLLYVHRPAAWPLERVLRGRADPGRSS